MRRETIIPCEDGRLEAFFLSSAHGAENKPEVENRAY